MTDDESDTQSERPLTDQERAELYREQLKELHVIDLVRDMMVTLVTIGYEKLGLTDQTRDLRDLADARVAIESLRRLIEVVEGEGDPEAATLRSTLAQMQLNFARASAESRAAAPAEPRDAAGAEPRDAASAPQQAAPASGAPPRQAAPESGAAGTAKEPSEAESRRGVEAEEGARKAPAAPAPPKKAATAKPKSGSAVRQTPRKAPAKKAASPAKKAASPKKTPRKKPSGGGTPPGA